MEQANHPTLGAVIGERLVRLRREKPWLARQDDVALRMHAVFGLRWTQPTVAAIEAGRRDVSMGELLALSLACELPVHEWFDGDGQVEFMPGSYLSRRAVRALLGSGEHAEDKEGDFAGPRWAAEHSDEVAGAVVTGILRNLVPDASPVTDADAVAKAARGSAERKAAHKLDLKPVEVSALAFHLWGRSLTAERDARVDEWAPPDATARSRQAFAGQATRALLTELRAVVGSSPGDTEGESEGEDRHGRD